MSENLNCRDFSQYDEMSTEELEEILRLDAEAPEGQEPDVELLLHIMEVLKRRDKIEGHNGKTALEAFQSFQQYYMPCEEDEIYGDEPADLPAPARKPRRWLRTLSAVAAVLAVVILCTFTVDAFRVSVWDAVAKWTRETFHFGSPYEGSEASEPGVDDETRYTELRDTLLLHKIEINLAPTWFPDGYEFVDVKITETPKQRMFIAAYQRGDEMIKIQIKDYLGMDPEQIEQSDDLLETYESAGIDYYIFENNGLLKAVWLNKNYECYISGNLTLEEMKTIINSI